MTESSNQIGSRETCGRIVQVVPSAKSAVGQYGAHFIMQFEGMPPRGTIDERLRAALFYEIPWAIGVAAAHTGLSPEEFRVEINGGLVASAPHDHAHIIMINTAKAKAAAMAWRRSVDPIFAPAPVAS